MKDNIEGRQVVIYGVDYLDIPLQDMPPIGHLIVCKDSQKRLQTDTWAVLRTVSDDGVPPAHAIGLFWDKDVAVSFADCLIRGHE